MALPTQDFTENGSRSPHWLKRSGPPCPLDDLVPTAALIAREGDKLSPALAEEKEWMKLRVGAQKAVLTRKLDGLAIQVKVLEEERDAVTGDRLKRLRLEKQATGLRRELLRGRENQFFDAMRLDVELEEQIRKFTEQEKLTAKVIREFVVKVRHSSD